MSSNQVVNIGMICGCKYVHDKGNSQYKYWVKCEIAQKLWQNYIKSFNIDDRKIYNKHYEMRLFTFTDMKEEYQFKVIAANFKIAVHKCEEVTGLQHKFQFKWKHDCAIPLDTVVITKNDFQNLVNN